MHWKICQRTVYQPGGQLSAGKNMILTYDYASMRDITIRPAASIKDNNALFRVPARLDPDTEDLFYPASDLTDIYDITWRGDTRQQIIQMIRLLKVPEIFIIWVSYIFRFTAAILTIW